MNPWLAAALAAGALWLVNHGRQQQAQADAAAAGHQAGAGETSDQGGGSFEPFGGQPVMYQGGTTQPITSVNYQPPGNEDSTSGSSSVFIPSANAIAAANYSPGPFVPSSTTQALTSQPSSFTPSPGAIATANYSPGPFAGTRPGVQL